jgi:hypothetical protein
MLSQNDQIPHVSSHAIDQLPDYRRYRERAHHERTKAINSAMSMVWNRLTGRRARQKSDAAFWTA